MFNGTEAAIVARELLELLDREYSAWEAEMPSREEAKRTIEIFRKRLEEIKSAGDSGWY